MILTLKEKHDRKLKKTIVEFKQNPELLKEAFDMQQLNEMASAIQKLIEVFSQPEFSGLESFRLGLQKAATSLKKLLTASAITRALFINKELKTISSFTMGIGKLLQQLPQIITIVRSASVNMQDWNPDVPLNEILVAAAGEGTLTKGNSLKELKSLFLKAMKPGVFGFGSLPYINDREAVDELVALSYNDIIKLQKSTEKKKVVQRTIVDPSFRDNIMATLAAKLADAPVLGSETQQQAQDTAKRNAVQQEPESEQSEQPEQQFKPLNDKVFKNYAYQIYRAVFDKQHQGTGRVSISNKEQKFLDAYLDALTKVLINKGGLVK